MNAATLETAPSPLVEKPEPDSFVILFLQVEQLYTFRRPDEVCEFLQAHPFLIPLLIEAHSNIAEYFGPSSEVVLEVVTDPEVPESTEMFGYIATSLTPEEAGNRLQHFDREWFLPQLHRAKGRLNFDVEFRRLHPQFPRAKGGRRKAKDNRRKAETAAEPPTSPFAYELSPDLLAAYHRLLDKKFSEGLTPEEEAEFERVGQELDQADMQTPLGQAIMQRAEEEHHQWMTTLEEVIAKLRSLRKSL